MKMKSPLPLSLSDSNEASASLRDTYANVLAVEHRLKAAGACLGVAESTIRGYADQLNVTRRASDTNPASPPVRVFDIPTIFDMANYRRQLKLVKLPRQGSRPVIITVLLAKGGVGKSTTTCELAMHLQLGGLRVLVIDLDSQSNLTHMMGYEADFTLEESSRYGLTDEAIVQFTFASVGIPFCTRSRGQLDSTPSYGHKLFKYPFGPNGPALIPADTFLADLEIALANASGHRELYVKNILDAGINRRVPGFDLSEFDVVLFDCPPSMSFATRNTLAAADIVIAPIRLDTFSIKGLTKLWEEMSALNQDYQVRPELVILPTHYEPNLQRTTRMNMLLEKYKAYVVQDIFIPRSELFPKSTETYLPLSLLQPTAAPVTSYKKFAGVIHDRIIELTRKQAPTAT